MLPIPETEFRFPAMMSSKQIYFHRNTTGSDARMTTLLTLLIGMFIGWNLPQPVWARTIQDKVMQLLGSASRK
jgi:hypothetical protein